MRRLVAVPATVVFGALAASSTAQGPEVTITAKVVYRTSQKPVAGREVWVRSLSDAADPSARPGYWASPTSTTTDSEGRFSRRLSTRVRTVFGFGLGLGSFLDKREGGGAEGYVLEANASGNEDLGVLVADDGEELVPAASRACQAAEIGAPVTPPTGVGFLLLVKRPHALEQTPDKRQSFLATLHSPWELDAELQRRAAAKLAPGTVTLACALETKSRVGEYRTHLWPTPVAALRTDWRVWALMPDARVERKALREDPPREIAAPATDPRLTLDRRPDDRHSLPERLGEWLATQRAARP